MVWGLVSISPLLIRSFRNHFLNLFKRHPENMVVRSRKIVYESFRVDGERSSLRNEAVREFEGRGLIQIGLQRLYDFFARHPNPG